MAHLAKLLRNLAPASLVLMGLSGVNAYAADVTPEPVDTNSTALWAGVAFDEDANWGVHAGGVWAANGDLDASGLLFRGQALFVDWDASDNDGGDGQIARVNASIGYQFGGDGVAASIFAGIDYQDVDVDDDSDLDDEVGLIVTGRIATNGDTDVPMSLEGNYSTANDTYWARARVGYKFDWISIGPEVAALGDDGFDAFRIGGYTAFNLSDSVILDLNAGYQDATGRGSDDGLYGGATIVFVF
jgi:hypothetical protein